MKILIVGAGGVGGYYGAALVRSGVDVTFLLRPQRQKLIAENGLTIESPKERYTVQPQTTLAENVDERYDVVILSPKAYDLDSVISDLTQKGKLGNQTMILPLLNGFAHLKKLDNIFGKERVMAGVAYIFSTQKPDGTIVQFNQMQGLTVGARHPHQESLAKAIHHAGVIAGYHSVYSEDIEQVLWEKWIFLTTLAAITTVSHGDIGEIVATRYGKEITLAIYNEVLTIAEKSGHAMRQAAFEKSQKVLTEIGSNSTASMRRDLEGSGRTEYEHIIGEMILAADKAGENATLLKFAYTQLAVVAGRLIAQK